jgi:hypothetical protein
MLEQYRRCLVKTMLLVCTIAAMLISSLAQAQDRPSHVLGEAVDQASHGFPRVAHDQSRVVKKRLRTNLDRLCNCKRRCDQASGYCMLAASGACSPGEFYPDVCEDCTNGACP